MLTQNAYRLSYFPNANFMRTPRFDCKPLPLKMPQNHLVTRAHVIKSVAAMMPCVFDFCSSTDGTSILLSNHVVVNFGNIIVFHGLIILCYTTQIALL